MKNYPWGLSMFPSIQNFSNIAKDNIFEMSQMRELHPVPQLVDQENESPILVLRFVQNQFYF